MIKRKEGKCLIDGREAQCLKDDKKETKECV